MLIQTSPQRFFWDLRGRLTCRTTLQSVLATWSLLVSRFFIPGGLSFHEEWGRGSAVFGSETISWMVGPPEATKPSGNPRGPSPG